ncbi:TonB-dependent receptor domain-containing protein [Campylobacter sp. MOP7]|uniref:TonB-dependent receptor domain-containing protein n=1 Tax=Campylobacter canis TaxID=3378588 RepID=UPI00387E40E3
MDKIPNLSYHYKNKSLSIVVAIALSCSWLLAKDDKTREIIDLQEVKVTGEVTSSGYDNTALKSYTSAGSYSYLDETKISRFRGSSVGDFLSGIPGVMVGNKRNSGAISVNIRGIQNENRVPIVIDDSLQSIPSWQGYAGSSTRTFLDPDLISQVEIEKGPSLKADGIGATGGVVRMNTISYKDISPKDSEKDWGFRFTLGTMSNTVKKPAYNTRGGYRTKWIEKCETNHSGLCKEQTYKPDARYSSKNPFSKLGNSYNTSLAFTKKWENADIVLGYAKKVQGNYFTGKHGPVPEIETIQYRSYDLEVVPRKGRTPAVEEEVITGRLIFKNQDGYTYYRSGEEILNTSQDNESYLAKVNFYNEDHAVNLAYRGYRSKFGEMMPSLVSFRGDGALQGEGSEVKVDSYSSKYIFNPSNPYINLNISGYFTRSDSSNFTPFYEEYGHHDSRHAYFTLSKQYGININNKSIFELNENPLTLNYGISFSTERIHQPRNAQARVEKKGYPKDAIAPLYIRDAKRNEKSLFAWANYPLTDWLIADIGGRYINSKTIDYQPLVEFHGYHPDGKPIATKEYTPPIKNKGFSPIAMLTFEPTDEIQLYIKYAEAIRSPSLFQASRGFSMQSGDGSLSTLKPEKQKNWEVGTNLLFNDYIKKDSVIGFKFAFFNNYTKDYLTRTFTKKRGILQTTNIKSALYRGIEASSYFDMKSFYYQVGMTYYLKTKFCRKEAQKGVATDRQECFDGGVVDSNIGNTLPPKTTITATIGTRILAKKLDIGARYSHYGKRIVSIFSPESPGGDTSSAEWKPYSLVDLYAHYKVNPNLTISATIDNLTNRYYLDANNQGLIPAPGRTLRLNLDYRF